MSHVGHPKIRFSHGHSDAHVSATFPLCLRVSVNSFCGTSEGDAMLTLCSNRNRPLGSRLLVGQIGDDALEDLGAEADRFMQSRVGMDGEG